MHQYFLWSCMEGIIIVVTYLKDSVQQKLGPKLRKKKDSNYMIKNLISTRMMHLGTLG